MSMGGVTVNVTRLSTISGCPISQFPGGGAQNAFFGPNQPEYAGCTSGLAVGLQVGRKSRHERDNKHTVKVIAGKSITANVAGNESR